jgi:hypothetical protein
MYSIRYAYQILMLLEFPQQIFVKYWNTNFLKICPVAVRTDGQREMTKLIVVFRNFANAPKNERKLSSQ